MTRVDNCDRALVPKLIGHRSSFSLVHIEGPRTPSHCCISLAIGALLSDRNDDQTTVSQSNSFNAGWCLIDRGTVQDWAGLGISDGHPDLGDYQLIVFDQANDTTVEPALRNHCPANCHDGGNKEVRWRFRCFSLSSPHQNAVLFQIREQRSGLGIISRSPTGAFHRHLSNGWPCDGLRRVESTKAPA